MVELYKYAKMRYDGGGGYINLHFIFIGYACKGCVLCTYSEKSLEEKLGGARAWDAATQLYDRFSCHLRNDWMRMMKLGNFNKLDLIDEFSHYTGAIPCRVITLCNFIEFNTHRK